MRDPLVPLCAALAAGIAASALLSLDTARVAAALGACLLVAVAARLTVSTRSARWSVLAVLALTGALLESVRRPGPPPRIEFETGETLLLEGCVVEPPALTADREQFILELDPGARVRVNWYLREGETLPALSYGQRVELEARLRKPRNFGNPGAFDFVRYLSRLDIHWLATANSRSNLRRLPGECGSPLLAGVYRLREHTVRRLDAIFAGDPYAIGMTRAVIAGDDARLEPAFAADFRRTGVYHALVISGLHLTTLAVCIAAVLRLFSPGPVWPLLLISAAAWLYAFFTGAGPPVLRAAAGLTLFWTGHCFYRPTRVLNLLAGIAIVFLCADPYQLFDASFQFSFTAVGLIGGIGLPVLERTTQPYARGMRTLSRDTWDPVLAPPIAALRLEMRLIAETLALAWRIPRVVTLLSMQTAARAVFFAADLLIISASVQAGLALPMIVYFHQAPVTGLLANLLIVPAMNLVIPVTFFAVFTGSALAGRIVAALIEWTRVTASWLAAAEPGSVIPPPPLWLATAVAASVVLLAWSFRRSRAAMAAAAVPFTAALGLMLVHPFPPDAAPGWLDFAAIDVGQGDSLLITAPGGSTMLVDAGGFLNFGVRSSTPPALDIGADVVTPYLLSRSLQSLDIVVATHAHQDHIGGMLAVVRNFRPRQLWIGVEPADDESWRLLRAQLAAAGTELVELCAGQSISWSGTQITILSPPPAHVAGRNRNNNSLAFRIDYGESSFLLTGDVEKQMEARMLEQGLLREPADVLKVAHHGSRTSTTPEFLAAVRPLWAVISNGEANSFHHPHPDVVKRLEDAGVRILRTDRQGLIRFRTDGHRWETGAYSNRN